MRRLLLTVLIVLASCASAPPKEMAPVPLGNDTYMVGFSALRGSGSNEELASMAQARANAFCADLGRDAVIQETTASGRAGWVPQDARVVFRCVERLAAAG